MRVQSGSTPRSTYENHRGSYENTPNGVGVETTAFDHDPAAVHERQQSDLELQFPSHAVPIPEDTVSSKRGRTFLLFSFETLFVRWTAI